MAVDEDKKKRTLLLLIIVALLAYVFWFIGRPAERVAVHRRRGKAHAILVKNFLFTDSGKITWWLENRARLKEQYNVLTPANTVSFLWLSGFSIQLSGK